MSYLVLARKYRPRTFAEVVGQPHVAKTLRNALRLGRVAHAYLFAGPRGVGKTSVARILARSLLCEEGASENPCGRCERCRAILAGQDLDVVEIDAASNRGIDDIRALREKVRVAPMRGALKFLIVDEVHQLTQEAFNAFLKILEEPPPHARFVLCTTEPERIPDTIRSRCQAFEFRRVSEEEIAERLRSICEAEEVEAEPDALAAIARLARGGMRDAQSLLDQAITHGGGAVTLRSVEEITGTLSLESILPLLECALGSDRAGLLEGLARLLGDGAQPEAILESFTQAVRDLLIHLASNGRLETPASRRLGGRLEGVDVEWALAGVSLLLAARRRIRDHEDPRLPLEATLLRLAGLAEALPLGEAIARLSGARDATARAGPTAPAGAAGAPGRGGPTTGSPPDDPKACHAALVRALSGRKPALAAQLRRCEPVGLKGDRLLVRPRAGAPVPYDWSSAEARAEVSRAAQEVVGRPLVIETVAQARAGAGAEEPEDAFVEKARDLFEGEEA